MGARGASDQYAEFLRSKKWEVRMKKLILLMAIGMIVGACGTTTSKSKLKKTSYAEQALERQNLRR